jgi:hypothetical protein
MEPFHGGAVSNASVGVLVLVVARECPCVRCLWQGEQVLDLGSGGGIDVLLSARRVGPGWLRVRGWHD